MASHHFYAGAEVIYSFHGKHRIDRIEKKHFGGHETEFYKLEPIKNTNPSKTRVSSTIWLPCDSAPLKGLRAPMTGDDVKKVFEQIEGNAELHLPISEPWEKALPKLETAINTEGGSGIAKVITYLNALKSKQVVPDSPISKFYNHVEKAFCREAAEALGTTIKNIEHQIEIALQRQSQLLENM